MIRRILTGMGCAVVLLLMTMGQAANAQRVQFQFRGGQWSHQAHSGWHRYWGGPSVGFYFAPAPVYVVPGYDDYSYYDGPDFWYSNPSFGLSLNLGGGHGGGHYRGHSRGHYTGHSGGHMHGNRGHGH